MEIKPKRKNCRPKTSIDWKQVGEWIEQGCLTTHIADKLGISPDTLYRRCEQENSVTYTAFNQQKKQNGESTIHQAQYWLGVKEKNASMLIWLGKQRCGQRDHNDAPQVTPETLKAAVAVLEQLRSLQNAPKSDTENNQG